MVLRILDWDHRGTKCPHTQSTRISSLGRDSVVYREREDSQEVKCECVTGRRKCKDWWTNEMAGYAGRQG